MGLSKEQLEKLHDALLNAFPDESSLKRMLRYKLDKKLNEIVRPGNTNEIVFELIETAESENWIEDLVRAAREFIPSSLQLKNIAKELLPNPNPEVPLVSLTNNPSKETNQRQIILVVAAIPHGLRLDIEIREIEEAIRRALNQDLFELRIRTAVRPQDIRRAIAEEQPQIVHFCGHGLEDGSLLLEDEGRNNKPVSPEALASLFKLHKGYVKCVLLNACYSEKPAIEISQHIDYVIGMNKPIQEQAAIEFARGFYDATGASAVAGTSGTLLAIAVEPSATATGTVALAAGVGATASGTIYGLAVASLAPVALPVLGVLAIIGATAFAAVNYGGKAEGRG